MVFDCKIRNPFLRESGVNKQRLRSPAFKIRKVAVQLVAACTIVALISILRALAAIWT